jgi:5-bromo-4-chloroindolyl phosphate hydrolysis protein
MSKAKKLTKTNSTAPSAKILYIFLLVMFVSTAISLFQSNYLALALKLGGFVMLFGATKLIDKGLEEEAKYNSQKIAYAPKMKYKLFGYIVLGATLFYLNFVVGEVNIVYSIINASIGFVGAMIYYGQDPFKDKVPDNNSGVNLEKMLKELLVAQEKIEAIKRDRDDIVDYQLKNSIDKATQKAQNIIDNIKEDPKDIRVARKFMVVYLDGIKDVISKYKSIDKDLLDSSYTSRLVELLDSATKRFEDDLERLKSNEIFDLDVQIDALKKQFNN